MLPLLAAIIVACGSPESPPNVLLITVDTLRADRLGVYGYDQPTSPSIDTLAARSTVFDLCVASIATTVPSHATMLTGLYPRAHAVHMNKQRLSPGITTLTERLADGGFDTAAFVSLGALSRSVTEGFQTVKNTPTHREKRPAAQVVTENLLDWLGRREKGEPFFAWAHYFDPHAPYRPTDYSRARVDQTADYAQGITIKQFYSSRWFTNDASDRVVQALYDGQVESVDSAVGRIVSALEDKGLLADTFLVFTADHGQSLGDHNLPGHGPSLWNSVLHVPLIIYDGRDPKRSMHRVSTPVSLVDLTPTILDRLALESHGGIQGRSLLPALRGQSIDTVPIFSETRWPALADAAESDQDLPTEGIAVLHGELKLKQDPEGRMSWFDLPLDPEELTPLRPDQLDDRHRRLEALIAAYRAQDRRTPSAEIATPEEIEVLRALGYVE